MKSASFFLVIGAGLLAIVGTLLPWYVGEEVVVNGFDPVVKGEGMVIIGLFLARIGAIFLPAKWRRYAVILCNALVLFFIFSLLKTSIRLPNAGPGVGVWILLLALVLTFFPARPLPKSPK